MPGEQQSEEEQDGTYDSSHLHEHGRASSGPLPVRRAGFFLSVLGERSSSSLIEFVLGLLAGILRLGHGSLRCRRGYLGLWWSELVRHFSAIPRRAHRTFTRGSDCIRSPIWPSGHCASDGHCKRSNIATRSDRSGYGLPTWPGSIRSRSAGGGSGGPLCRITAHAPPMVGSPDEEQRSFARRRRC